MIGFSVLAPHDRDDLAALIGIYQEAIEPAEQKKPAEIEAMLSDPRYALTVSRTDGVVSGFSIAFFPDDADFWLLEYMAVRANVRSKRIGEAIFLEAYQYGLRRDLARVCLLEVDQPRSVTNPSNDAAARLRFYRRLGCRAVSGLNYILPLETHGVPPDMLLLAYRVPPLAEVRKSRVRDWLARIYVDVYGMAIADPRIDIMTSNLPDTVRLNSL